MTCSYQCLFTPKLTNTDKIIFNKRIPYLNKGYGDCSACEDQKVPLNPLFTSLNTTFLVDYFSNVIILETCSKNSHWTNIISKQHAQNTNELTNIANILVYHAPPCVSSKQQTKQKVYLKYSNSQSCYHNSK